MKKFIRFFALLVSICLLSGCTEEINNLITEDNFTHKITNEYTDSIGTHYIEGTVRNNTSKEYAYVQIEFVCYDKDGNNVGTALDNTNNLLGNESWKFKAMGLFTEKNIDHCNFKEITSW